jgi:hypothetical protein
MATTRKKTTAKKKAVAKPTEVGVSYYDETDAGAGFEDFTQDDIAIPFINVLQKLSPQVDEDNALFIDGAKPGMLFNTVTDELFDKDKGIVVIPVHRVHQYIEWVPRDSGGGFVAAHDPTDPMIQQEKEVAAFGEMRSPDGNDLVDTFTVYAIRVREDLTYEPIVLSFSKTQIGVYRKWMSRARSIVLRTPDGKRVTPPLFSHTYLLTVRGIASLKLQMPRAVGFPRMTSFFWQLRIFAN